MKFRNLLGYVVGSAIFLVLFPYLIRIISQKFAFIIILPIVLARLFLCSELFISLFQTSK